MLDKDVQRIKSGDDSLNIQAGRDSYVLLFQQADNFPNKLVEQAIQEQTERLRKSRFFHEFDTVKSALTFANQLVSGQLSGGAGEIRSIGLSWCARYLGGNEQLEKAEELLALAQQLGNSDELVIARAFLLSRRHKLAEALQTLASLDSPAARTAGLMVVGLAKGPAEAIEWISDAGIECEQLDSDGKSYLLSRQLELGCWDDAQHTLDALQSDDYDRTPLLHRLSAVTALLPCVPNDLRGQVVRGVPFDAGSFRLASSADAMKHRMRSLGFFRNAVQVALDLDFPDTASFDDEYCLWLELKDPNLFADGVSRLQQKLRDPQLGLGVVHLALQFGISLDLQAVERDIDREVARNGGMTLGPALARFALSFTQDTPEEAANYIDRYFDQLLGYINPTAMRYRQIELYAKAGMSDRANECLEEALIQGISADEENVLNIIIAEARGNDPVEALKEQFRNSDSVSDLINLVEELERHSHWDELIKYGEELFKRTHSLQDAERYVFSLNRNHNSASIVEFLEENEDFIKQSQKLQMTYAWALYSEGELIKCQSTLESIGDQSESQNYRTLLVNLNVSIGNWSALNAHILSEYHHKADRSANELIAAAQLAQHIGLDLARELTEAAVEKSGDDPAVYAGACFLATSAGWEDEQQVHVWLERAIELSGEEGPIQQMSLKDIFENKPSWDKRETDVWTMLRKGDMPAFLAAESLNRSLLDLTLFPALSNFAETDLRRRSMLPAYSGARTRQEVRTQDNTAVIESMALITLSFLNVLDTVLDAFREVWIPHSTLGWLFEERQKAAFHQPSRVKNAQQLWHLLGTKALERLDASAIPNSELSTQVGNELAILIAEAEKASKDDEVQRVVVRPAPVHRVSTLMEEEADLSQHYPVLSSCLAVVEKLRQKGQITVDEERRARVYLQVNEKTWPSQPEIQDGAVLYLDDLAISYFQHLGLLEKIPGSGLRAVVSPKELEEVRDLISYDSISNDVRQKVEEIRKSLGTRILSGQIKVARQLRSDIGDLDGEQHPTVSLLAIAPQCDYAIVDDRLVNQHPVVANGNDKGVIVSTLDLIDALHADGSISEDQRLELRTRLRRAGYFFVPVEEGELERLIMSSQVTDGRVVETAELKAVRESILRIRMSDWLQLPKEAPWLHTTLMVFKSVLKQLWLSDAEQNEVVARSNWIVDQIDIRGWAHRLVPPANEDIVWNGRGAYVLAVLSPPIGVDNGRLNAYLSWAEEKILVPIQEQHPELFEWLTEKYKLYMAEIVDEGLARGNE